MLEGVVTAQAQEVQVPPATQARQVPHAGQLPQAAVGPGSGVSSTAPAADGS